MKLTAVNRRRIVVAGAVLFVFSVVGFLVAPPIIKTQLEARASQALGRTVTVERVRVNPYTLSVTLEDFSVKERDGVRDFFGWKRLYVRLDPVASLWSAWGLSKVDLRGFHARVALGADRMFNFADILARVASVPREAPSKPGRPFKIGTLTVSGAQVIFQDDSRKQPFTTTAGPISFTLTGFSTAGGADSPYRFEAATESGETFAWSGTLQAQPLASSGQFKIEGVDLPKYAPYYSDQFLGVLAAGKVSASGNYMLVLKPGAPEATMKDGALRMTGLKVLERDTRQTALELQDLTVSGIDADAIGRKATVRSVALAGGRVSARRERDGEINLLELLPQNRESTASPSQMPQVAVGDTEVSGLDADLTDLAGPRPARLELNGILLSIKDLSLAAGSSMPMKLSFQWAPRGTVSLSGTVGLKPLTARLDADARDLALLPLSPFLEQVAGVKVSQGTLSSKVTVQADLPAQGPLQARAEGGCTVSDLGLVDAAHSESLAGFKSFEVSHFKASTSPSLSVAIDGIAVTDPFLRAVVNADGTINLLSALSRSEAGAKTAAPAGPPPAIDIGKLSVTGGSFQFVDRSLEPNARMDVEQFHGTITGLASGKAKGDVNLTTVVGGSGTVSIVGKLDPLGAQRYVDLAVDCRNVDLLPLSPYSEKFAGFELARGKLGADLKVLLDSDRIDATNVVTLNQFTFGQPVTSRDATTLPVRLGVALLKDVDGKIVIDVPVRGRLDDPDFRIGRVVLRVLVNLLTKAAVSPFSLVGSMFGGGGDELAYQEFEPGSSRLEASESKKLQTLTAALTNRPGLSLGIEGDYDPAADVYALKRSKLADLVRRRIWSDAHQANPNVPPPDKLAITPDQSAAMIKRLFDAQFPPGTPLGTPLPPPPPVAAPPAPPAGFFSRLVAALTLKDERDRNAARKENDRKQADYQKTVAAAEGAGLPLEEMSSRLAETMTVTSDDLRALAAERAANVREYFVQSGKLDPARLFLTQTAGPAKEDKGPRVFLELQ